MLDLMLLLLVGLLPALGALRMLDRVVQRNAAQGRPPMRWLTETALHWAIFVVGVGAIFATGMFLSP